MIEMIGKKFGRLTPLLKKGKSKSGSYLWECQCDCGNIICVNGSYLRTGDTKSCGCIKTPNEIEYNECLKKRLLKYSEINHTNGCREWSVKNRMVGKGYGCINYRSKQILAHRASWIVWKGNIPDEVCVLHKCDNPSCINPEHLFLGTIHDNTLDMMSKNRQNFIGLVKFGSKNQNSVLDEELVILMRIIRNHSAISYKKLSMLFQCQEQLCRKVCKYEIWNHLTKEDEEKYDFSKWNL